MDGKLGLVFQSAGGEACFGPIDELRADVPCKVTDRLQTLINLDRFGIVPTSEYLAAVGTPNLCPGGQRCYEFETKQGPVVIPGQTLVVSLVGATTLMRAPLLSPQGPTALMTAFNGDELSVVPTPKRMRQFQTDRWSTVCRMRWILTHPSAAKAWSSVYAHATKGRLDLALPKASVTAALRGVASDGKFWVTGAELLTLAADEPPHAFVNKQALDGACWNLVTNAVPKKRMTPALTREVPPPMTDTQWADFKAQVVALKPKIARKERTTELRYKLDFIRQHLATGVSLYMLPGDRSLVRACVNWVKTLKTKGHWTQVEAALLQTI
ncbi:hypothetical protein [Rhodoferax sp. U11-2br]|uniref:hypothetical protein n=1 Tax=Rhodoferax sp. U11-2br TaxID=2838878 RepID=UPI001BE523F5|nr:hypothetical protein [Rhodoferax sp. U11-2br]MBT3067965.1 hypothetical protein [Rhodoferax sp. U11-2br]